MVATLSQMWPFKNTGINSKIYTGRRKCTYLNQNVLEILSQSLPSLFMENRLFMSTTALRDIDTPGGQCPITINLRKFLSMKNNDKTNPNTETKLPQVNGILPCQISNLGTLYNSYLSINCAKKPFAAC